MHAVRRPNAKTGAQMSASLRLALSADKSVENSEVALWSPWPDLDAPVTLDANEG